MAFEHKPGSGSIFPNDYKEKDSQPDYKGQIKTPDGHLYEIALWTKDGKRGEYFSASIQEPRVRQPKDYDAGADADFDGDAPF